jgi:hypothetical protein
MTIKPKTQHRIGILGHEQLTAAELSMLKLSANNRFSFIALDTEEEKRIHTAFERLEEILEEKANKSCKC